MRVVIIDDDSMNLDLVKAFCTRFATGLEIVGTAENVDNGVRLLEEVKPDILFLDIQLYDKTGFDILNRINQPQLMVVMITAFAEYAVEAFRVNVVDYLLKPLVITNFQEAVEKCRKLYTSRNAVQTNNQPVYASSLHIPNKGNSIFIPVEDIVRLEAEGSYTKVIVNSNKQHIISKSIQYLESCLSPSIFLRIHNSHIININTVRSILSFNEGKIELANGNLVPVAERRRKQVMTQLKWSA